MFLTNAAQYGLPEFRRPAWQRYGAGLLAAAAACACSVLLQQLTGASAPWLVAFLPVILTAWYGGLGASLIAAAAGALTVLYFFVLPSGLIRFAAGDGAVPLATYVLASFSVALLAEAYRHRLREAAEQIETLQKTEEQLHFSVSHIRGACETLRADARRESAQRKSAEEQLSTIEDRIHVAESAAGLRVFDWELKHKTIQVSGDLETIFGIPAEQWTGYDSWIAAVHPEDRERTQKAIERALESRGQLEIEHRVVWPNGRERWICSKGNVLSVGDTPLRMVGIYMDITEQKTTEQALIRHEKLAAAGRMAATIAHEINNPLAALTNLLYIVRSDNTLSRAGAQYVSMAQEELKRISQLANQALGFYKENTTAGPVALPELLDEVLALYTRNIAANVRIEKHYGRSVELTAVRGELWQVFANIISNALYAVRGGGTMAVQARAVKDGMEVIVRDTGPGIGEEHMDHIFQPFFTTKQEMGTGLGLWIVKEIVEKHGGEIHVSSNVGEKHGTSMTVFLPAAPAVMHPPSVPAAIQASA